jgi:hypothetical protein
MSKLFESIYSECNQDKQSDWLIFHAYYLQYNMMNVLPESGIYDYDPGDRCVIQFELPNYFKLQKNSGYVIICQSIIFHS